MSITGHRSSIKPDVSSVSSVNIAPTPIHSTSRNLAGSHAYDTPVEHVPLNNYTDTIKVFGFPIDKASDILSHFRRFGTMVRYEISNNWIVITYNNETSAKHALTVNASVIDDYMIGVILCESESLPQERKKTFKYLLKFFFCLQQEC